MSLPTIQSGLPRPYTPEFSEFTRPFWEGLNNGEFLIAQCDTCQAQQFPPRPQCPACNSDRVSWQASAGSGTLYSSTRVHAAAGPFACMTPYSVGIVDLDEGVRILTRLMHDASSLSPGSRVQLAVLQHADGPLFVAVSTNGVG